MNFDDEPQLKDYFPLSDHIRDKDINCLQLVRQEEDYGPDITAVITCLRRLNCGNLGHVLELTPQQLGKVYHMGKKRQRQLFMLLLRIYENPNLIENYEFTATNPKPKKQKRLSRSKYVNDVMERFRMEAVEQAEELPMTVFESEQTAEEEEQVTRGERLEAIKKQLRDMGMIQ